MITISFLWPALEGLETEGMDLEKTWFQLDEATCHT